MSEQASEVKDKGKQVVVPLDLYERMMSRKESNGQTISFQVSQAVKEWLDKMDNN